MEKHADLGKLLLDTLGRSFALRKKELGADARLSKKGMAFETEVYTIGEIGQLCILRMRAMLGLMRMETAVVSVTGRDLPLFNVDWVLAMGKETLMAELYDTQLSPCSQEALDAFQKLKDRDADLPAPEAKPHWYDPILYPCSYCKTGKGLTERFNAASRAYVEEFVTQLAAAPACDPREKGQKVRAFAETLFSQGGPAVDAFTGLFGREVARRMILDHMYGASQDADQEK